MLADEKTIEALEKRVEKNKNWILGIQSRQAFLSDEIRKLQDMQIFLEGEIMGLIDSVHKKKKEEKDED